MRTSEEKNKLLVQEQRDRQMLEKIARDHIAEGLSDLAKIEATGLWRKIHKTFDAYRFDKFSFNPLELNAETLIKKLEKTSR